jgi:hypothetical protein
VCKFIAGRLRVLKPRRKDYKEVRMLRGITHALGAVELREQCDEIYNNYIEYQRQQKVRAVERLGYEVSDKEMVQ